MYRRSKREYLFITFRNMYVVIVYIETDTFTKKLLIDLVLLSNIM